MSATALDEHAIIQELVVSIRNGDVFTTTQRDVTTTAQTGTLTGTTISINRSNVKNIRSITIGAVTKTFGDDYLVEYDNSGTCLVTFNTSQNDTYSISYDYGTDKIFADFPRSDLTISSFPRIGVDFVDIISDNGGMGNVNLNTYDISIAVYGSNKDDIHSYTKKIRQLIIDNQNNFYYMKVVKPRLMSPIIPGQFEKVKDKIFQRNIDIRALLNLEIT
mgnify:CR=1 FL=1